MYYKQLNSDLIPGTYLSYSDFYRAQQMGICINDSMLYIDYLQKCQQGHGIMFFYTRP